MNPQATHSDPNPTMYGFPCAVWTLPRDTRTPFLNRLYEDACAVLTDPDGPTARITKIGRASCRERV